VPRVVLAIVLDKVFTFLVDGIISQVHAKVVEVAADWRDVILGGKPC
jgi:hypothetical protein